MIDRITKINFLAKIRRKFGEGCCWYKTATQPTPTERNGTSPTHRFISLQ